VLIKEISGERDGVANAAADHVANRFADGFSDDIETGEFDSGEGAGVLVERIFAWDQIGLAAVAVARNRLIHLLMKPGELERVHAHDAAAQGFERGDGTFATIRFADAGDAVIRFQLDDGA